MHSKPAWKRLLASPVTILVVVVLAIIIALSLTVPTLGRLEVAKQEYAKKCTLLGGYMAEIEEITFCINVKAVPNVVWDNRASARKLYQITNECIAAGGRILDISSENYDRGCYTYTIFEELGAKEDYKGGEK